MTMHGLSLGNGFILSHVHSTLVCQFENDAAKCSGSLHKSAIDAILALNTCIQKINNCCLHWPIQPTFQMHVNHLCTKHNSRTHVDPPFSSSYILITRALFLPN